MVNAIQVGDGVGITLENGETLITTWLSRAEAEKLYYKLNQALMEVDSQADDEQLNLNQFQ